MIEEKIDKLTAAVTQLTVTAEALLEVLRHRAHPADHQIAGKLTVTGSGTAMTISGPSNDLTVTGTETQPPDTTTLEVKPKRVRAPKAEAPAPAPAAEPEPAPAPAPAPVKIEYTIADLREAAQRALDNGKLNDVVNINKEYGLKRISDANPDQYVEIIAKLQKLTADGQA